MSTIACDTPSQPIGDTRSALDEPAWRTICEAVATDAMKGCGLSHDYYIERPSLAIDTQVLQLPESQRAQALQIAQEWDRSEEHTSELQSLMRTSYAVFCLQQHTTHTN